MLKQMMKETIFSTEEANKILHSIYLFGSFIKTASANDIDILIIYHYFECLNEMKALYNIKEQIGNRLYGTFKIPIHFITLSTDELECICIPQQKGITPRIKSRKVHCLCGFPAFCLLFELDLVMAFSRTFIVKKIYSTTHFVVSYSLYFCLDFLLTSRKHHGVISTTSSIPHCSLNLIRFFLRQPMIYSALFSTIS